MFVTTGQGPATDIRVERPVESGATGEAAPGGGVEERHRGEGAHHRGPQDQGHPAQGQLVMSLPSPISVSYFHGIVELPVE